MSPEAAASRTSARQRRTVDGGMPTSFQTSRPKAPSSSAKAASRKARCDGTPVLLMASIVPNRATAAPCSSAPSKSLFIFLPLLARMISCRLDLDPQPGYLDQGTIGSQQGNRVARQQSRDPLPIQDFREMVPNQEL